MKIYKKILYALILIIFLSSIFVNSVYAIQDPIDNPDYFNPSSVEMGSNQKFMEKANIILTIIQVLGTIIAVVALMAIGIKYMFGSAAEKADYKGTMIPYIIGAIMLFAIPNFLRVLLDLIQSIKF